MGPSAKACKGGNRTRTVVFVLFAFSIISTLVGILLSPIIQSRGGEVFQNDYDSAIPRRENRTARIRRAEADEDDIIEKKGVVCNEDGDCKGYFGYSPPNRSPDATEVLRGAAAVYKYGPKSNAGGQLIHFPSHIKSEECISEWKGREKQWHGRGMSAWGEDLIVYEKFFSDTTTFLNGDHFYMEIGAHDGVRESNSRFFDLCLGWQGLLVEPHPVNYERMEKLRPNAHHLNVAPSCNSSSDRVSFPRHTFTNAKADDERGALQIHCGPLSYYLDQIGITHIDFWSLDVEGAELSILRTVDFDKVHIDVIIAESVNALKDKHLMGKEVRDFLQQKDYIFMRTIQIHKSDVFVHKRACHRYKHLECLRLKYRQKEVKCNDEGVCSGAFSFSYPNREPNTMELMHEEASKYTYGSENNDDGHLIFFPNNTKSEACVSEWKERAPWFRDRGMSAWNEDLLIFDAFFSNTTTFLNGDHFYMEIGAHDGVRESNSRFYDICLGWQGLLVEPQPINFAHLEKLRPNAHHLNVAPSCNSTSDRVSFPAHTFTNAVANDEGGSLQIHCGPLSYYLDQIGITHIDFWSLDVEGSELSILRTVDLDKVQIDVIMAESVNRLKGKEKMGEEVRVFLQQKDYIFMRSIEIKRSDVFLHKSACQRYDFPECRMFLNGYM